MEGLSVFDFNFLDEINISSLKEELFEDGSYNILPYKQLEHYPNTYFQKVGVDLAIYQFPTLELINFLKEWVIEGETIEIASGRGIIGKALGIPCTDSRIQEDEDYKKIILKQMQRPVTYGDHVEKLDCIEAIKKYKPKVVIASWYTGLYDMHLKPLNGYGTNEEEFIDDIETYILIGNESVHRTKFLMTKQHREYKAPWLISKAEDRKLNRIYIWTKKPIMVSAKKFNFKMQLKKSNPDKVQKLSQPFRAVVLNPEL